MELGYILAPERTKDKTFLELHIFKARDGATYSYIFPFSFFSGDFGPVFEKKVLLRYQYI